MIAPAPSLSLCWQKPSPLFINLSPLLPFCRRSAPHLGTSVPPTPRFLHASQSVIGYYRRALLSSLSSVVIPKDMCGIAIRRVLCLEWALPEGGIISPAQGHQTHTHTHIEGHARGKCHRGGSHSAGKSFPLSFCLPSLPLYIIEKATQQGTLGGCPSSSWKGGGYRGLMRWRIPTECLHRQILIKNSSVSSFVSSSALWPFFYLFHSSRKSSLPWSDTSFTFVLAVKVKTVQCGLDAAHPESGGGEYGYLLPGWDLLLNWLLAQKWRNWKDNLVMQVCR